MVKHSKGKNAKRSRLIRRRVTRGISRAVRSFNVGERVSIHVEAGAYAGMPHPRYRGRHGTIVGTQGSCYLVRTRDHDAEKTLVISGVHLERA